MTAGQTPRAPAGAGDADSDAAEGRVFTVSGEDWDELIAAANEARDFESGERIVSEAAGNDLPDSTEAP